MLKEKIYDYFRDKEKSDYKYSTDNIIFSPSACSKCQRQLFWKYTNVKPTNVISEVDALKFELGNVTHEKVQSIFKKLGIWLEGEDFKECEYKGLLWRYRIDGLLNINNEKCLCEIKSTYGRGFKNIENEPDIKHVYQLYLYMMFENIKHGYILYIGRDSGYTIEYFIDRDKLNIADYEDKILSKLCKLKENIKNNILPDRDYQIVMKKYNDNINFEYQKDKVEYKSDWMCISKMMTGGFKHCNYFSLCWDKEITDFKNSKEVFYEKILGMDE